MENNKDNVNNVIEQEERPILVALDNGLMNLKVICNGMRMIYPNKITKGHTKLFSNKTYNATYGKDEFTVGETALHGDYNEGKGDECHIINALVGVSHFVTVPKQKVYLIYGESVNMYYNDAHIANELRAKLEKEHKILVDEGNGLVEKSFIIEKLVVLPEGCGYLFADIKGNQTVKYIIDIGGITVNFIKANKCVPSETESFSKKLGMYTLIEKIRAALVRNGYSADLDDDEIKDLIEKSYLDKRGNEIVEEVIMNRMEEINRAISKNGFDLITQLKMREDSVEFIGGGSQILKPYIQKYFKTDEGVVARVVNEPVWANVIGFYEYGKVMFSKEIQ